MLYVVVGSTLVGTGSFFMTSYMLRTSAKILEKKQS